MSGIKRIRFDEVRVGDLLQGPTQDTKGEVVEVEHDHLVDGRLPVIRLWIGWAPNRRIAAKGSPGQTVRVWRRRWTTA